MSPEVAFCNAVGDALSRCAGADTACASLTTDCSKLTSLLSPSLLSAATTCMKSATCDGGGPLSCLGSSLGAITPTTAQQTFAQDYCDSCSVISGDTCTGAFYPSGGAHGLGTLLLPFGDSLVSAVDGDCTSSSLGKTACQASFSTCVSASAAKALATSISVDSASCLVKSIQAGIANIGTGDGGAASDGGMTLDEGGGGDGGAACNNVANAAPTIALENLTGTAPAPAGGTIADGTYYLLSLRNYGAPYADTTVKETLVFAGGNHYDDVTLFEGDTSPTTESAVYTALGTTYTRSFTCPSQPARGRSYTATANTFTAYDETGTLLWGYVRQ